MENVEHLRSAGLFDAQVPRYTSYPPANHFVRDVGRAEQDAWMSAIPEGEKISLYVHIPFCKRLCWFCACRTQGTQSLRPVESYIENLLDELKIVKSKLGARVSLSRLHLGGGTPTILSSATMSRLLNAIFDAFRVDSDFEFSVEVDPTEAADDLLETLAGFGMNRASIGVQDFAPKVQEAIGRLQSFDQTAHVVRVLRNSGVRSINMDLLYGLPFQTRASLTATLQQVLALEPDRLALYGYAHVPWMAKRQVMIKDETLPAPEARYGLSQLAKQTFELDGYQAIGIDHFAKPSDSLAIAAQNGRLRRNFQGYTDDPAQVLIGLGASAISQFRQGYIQNAPATSAYIGHIREGRLAGARGFVSTNEDKLKAAMIEDLMCTFALDSRTLAKRFPGMRPMIETSLQGLAAQMPEHLKVTSHRVKVKKASRPLVRIIAHRLDTFRQSAISHSSAI